MNKKKYAALLVLVGIVFGVYRWYTQPPKALFTTEPVARADVRETVSVVGKLQPTQYADLSFSTVGTIKSIAYAQGAEVHQGDVIALLDTAVLDSELSKARVDLSIAIKNEQLARRTWDTLKPEERAVKKLATEQVRGNIRTIEAQIRESRLVAPLDGTLSSMDGRVGETVLAGKVIGRVSGPGNFIIKADVPEADIAKVTIGKPIAVTFDALSSDETLSGKVVSIEPSATVIQDVIYYTVSFTLDGQDDRLKEGMSANVDVIISDQKHVLVVPYRALIRDGSHTYVEVATGPTTFDRRPITVGVEGDDGLTEVLSGVAEGDSVIVNRSK